MRQLISNISIITQNKQRELIPRGFILLENDLIKLVGIGSYSGPNNNIDSIIDGAGLVATPGLINPHVHLGETIYYNFLPQEITLENYLKLTGVLVGKYSFIEKERETVCDYSAWQLIKNGISTIGGGRVSKSANSLGLRSISGYMVMKSNKLSKFAVNIQEQYLKELLINSNNKLSQQALFVHSLSQINREQILEVQHLSKKFPKMLIMIHVAETKNQEDVVVSEFGEGSIAVLQKFGLLNKNTILIHGNWLTSQDFKLINEAGASLIHCLSSNIKVADRVLDVDSALSCGINVCLATDGFVTAGTFSILEEAKNVYLRNRELKNEAISVQKVFDMITVDAAQALGLESVIGSIEIGKKADLALWINQSPESTASILDNFVAGKTLPELDSLIVDGKIIMLYKELLTKDESIINSKFSTLTKKIKELESENSIS